jgi:hypothetical protein
MIGESRERGASLFRRSMVLKWRFMMFRKSSFGLILILAVLVATPAAPTARAEVIVAPNALAAVDGNFHGDTANVGPLRYMQVYNASQFASLSGPALLTQFALRPDGIPGPSGPKTPTYRVYASTTSRSVADLSTTFNTNLGTDNTLVFEGPLVLTTANLPGPGNTRQFDIVFPMTTPFPYDPAAGSLLLDFQIAGSTGVPIRRDAVNGDPNTTVVTGFGSATAVTGSKPGFGFVTEFTFEPIPGTNVLPGDYDKNSVVDAADYIVWRSMLGQAGAGLAADGDASGTIDAADYNLWRAHFGTFAARSASVGVTAERSADSAAVPEPSTLRTLVALAFVMLLGCRPRIGH